MLSIGVWAGVVAINALDAGMVACEVDFLGSVMAALEFVISEPFKGFSC